MSIKLSLSREPVSPDASLEERFVLPCYLRATNATADTQNSVRNQKCGSHTVVYGRFLKIQIALRQCTLRPYLVSIWSRYPPESGENETFVAHRVGLRTCRAGDIAGREACDVVLQKSIPAQTSQLILYISNNGGHIDEFVGELTFAERLDKHFV